MNSYKFIFSIVAVCGAFAVFAQPAPPATPIDGGLSLLLAGGAAYGMKKIHNTRKVK